MFHECSIRLSTLSGVSCQHNVKGYWILLQFALGFGHVCCLFIMILGGPCPSYHFERGGTSFIWPFFETQKRGEDAASNAVTPQVSIPKPFKVKLSKLVVETKTTKTTDGACLFGLAGEHALNQFGYGFF